MQFISFVLLFVCLSFSLSVRLSLPFPFRLLSIFLFSFPMNQPLMHCWQWVDIGFLRGMQPYWKPNVSNSSASGQSIVSVIAIPDGLRQSYIWHRVSSLLGSRSKKRDQEPLATTPCLAIFNKGSPVVHRDTNWINTLVRSWKHCRIYARRSIVNLLCNNLINEITVGLISQAEVLTN